MEENKYILQLKNVHRQLGNFQIKNVSFTLEPGYIMGLVGRNGAGKSTLIKILLGVYKADAGEIKINEISMTTAEKMAKTQVGFVLEEQLFSEGMSLIKNAEQFGQFYPAYSREEFLNYCESLELNPKSKAGKLSKGEYLKFALAFAMSYKPGLLVLDEPTANFDIEARKKVKKMLREFVSDGQRSVLYATHLMEELDELADYITYLKQGEIQYSVDKETLKDKYQLIKGRKSLLQRMPKEGIVHIDENEYGISILVRKRKDREYPIDAGIYLPTLEDIVYAQMAKEEEYDFETDFKRI